MTAASVRAILLSAMRASRTDPPFRSEANGRGDLFIAPLVYVANYGTNSSEIKGGHGAPKAAPSDLEYFSSAKKMNTPAEAGVFVMVI